MSLLYNFTKISSDKHCKLSISRYDVKSNCSEPAIKMQYGALLKVLLAPFVIIFSKYRSANRSKIYIFWIFKYMHFNISKNNFGIEVPFKLATVPYSITGNIIAIEPTPLFMRRFSGTPYFFILDQLTIFLLLNPNLKLIFQIRKWL